MTRHQNTHRTAGHRGQPIAQRSLLYSLCHSKLWRCSWIMLLIVFCLTLFPATPARADVTIYLPLVSQGAATPTGQSYDFTVEWVRLWSIWENGGTPSPLTCGAEHTLQVDLFDIHGEGSIQPDTINGRLNGITVSVTHVAPDGTQTTETQVTGADGNDAGVVHFDLAAGATVQVSADADGEPVSSPLVSVTTNSAAIPITTLIGAGYCTDESTCQALIDGGQCNGTFSWGVVFKRTF